MKADDDSSNGSAGFIAGGSTGVLSAVTGGTRYKAVVSDNDSYAQVSQGIYNLATPPREHPLGISNTRPPAPAGQRTDVRGDTSQATQGLERHRNPLNFSVA